MRWKTPKKHDIKIKKKFALLPIKTNDETRWLERVTVKYQFFDNEIIKYDGEFCRVTGWFPIEFIDE